MVKIIVNADDFGVSSQVNDSVARLLAQKKITSATILANSESLDEVLDITRQYPNVSFGAHLNLTAGKSLTQNPVFYDCGIMDEKGDFILKKAFQNVPNPNEALRKAIKEEWQAQISVIQELGIPISHLDGHHHCNTWNGLLPTLREIVKENKIFRVRSTFRFPTKENFSDKVKSVLIDICSKSHSKLLSYENRNNSVLRWLGESVDHKRFRDGLVADGFVLTDYFCSFSNYIQYSRKGILNIPDNSTIELMAHPGVPRFNNETEILFQTIFDDNKYKLISYYDL